MKQILLGVACGALFGYWYPTMLGQGKAGAEMAKILGHERAEKKFTELGAAGWTAARNETHLREEENYPLNMGSRV